MAEIFNNIISFLTSLGLMEYFSALPIVILAGVIWAQFIRDHKKEIDDDND